MSLRVRTMAWSHVWRSVCLCGVALAVMHPVRAADSNDPGLLQQFDNAWEDLRTRSWLLHDVASLYGQDTRGIWLSQDIETQVLPAELRARIQQQRDAAVAAYQIGQTLQAEEILNSLLPDLRRQRQQLETLYHYWNAVSTRHLHDLEWQRLHQDYAELSTVNHNNQIALLEARVDELAKRGELASATQEAERLSVAYRDERALLMQHLTRSVNMQSRLSPCAGVASKTSRDDRPRFANSLRDVSDFYPPLMAEASITGTTILQIDVNETGCVTAAGVAQSSGTAALDDAALQWIETAVFSPVAWQGKAVPATTQIKVTFRAHGDN